MHQSSANDSRSIENPRRGLPLERKLPLLIFGLLALVLTVSLVVSYYAMRRAAETSAAARLKTLGRALVSTLDQSTTARMSLLRRAARDSSIVSAVLHPDQPPSARATQTLSTLRVAGDSQSRAELWTRDGRPVGQLTLDVPAERHRAVENEISANVPSDSGRVSRLRRAGNQTSFWETVPVRAGGDVVGYIVNERHIATNSPRAVQGFRDLIGSDIGMYLRNADDDTWAPVLNPRANVSAPPSVEPFGDSLTLFKHTSGDALGFTTPLRGTPLLLTVEQPMTEVLAGPRRLARVLAMIALVLVVIGGLVAWALSRQLVQPLVALTGAAEAMAHGQYAQRVVVDSSGEIGRLGGAFNRMAEQVRVASEQSTTAVEQLTKSVATQQFLADAGRILSTSLSDQILLTDLARFCVPAIADYCSIHVAEDDGSLRRVETAHHDPAKQEDLRALVGRYQYSLDGPGEVSTVIRSQQPLLIPRLDGAAIKAAMPDDDTRHLYDAIAPRSFMCVPLIARGRAFGAMSFTMTDSGRVFGPSDLELANELARRTAVAIDNALIYRRSVALRLEAEAASSAKSDFLAKMSHEIRTPINAMMGYAELIEMGISGPVSEAQAKQLNRIRASGEHLTSLVNEILDLAKIEAGHMGVEPTNGVAGEAIDAALSMVRPLATTKGVQLSSHVDGDPSVEYRGDSQRVQQIVANLLSNAIKFTPSGGKVQIACSLGWRGGDAETQEAWVCISVTDTGVGIAESDLERVFDPFVQVEGGYTRSQGGTGLGLTISRGLAHMMNGEITVESTIGEGSRFTLWLPVAHFVHK